MSNGGKPPPQKARTENQRLNDLAKHAYNVLRKLKMGDRGTISCGRQFPMDEVRGYIYGYAFHKKKWFDIQTDSVSSSLIVTRAPKPKPIKHFDEEEEA